MCGLVGMMGNIYDQDKKALRNLLRFDTVRGEDSTGLAVIEKYNNNNILLYKRVGAPDYLFAHYTDFTVKGVYNGPTPKVMIGHNRWATKGKITDENAHPFLHGSVVGAHNGTLVSTWPLEGGEKFDVDSETIFYNLNKFDNKDVIRDVWGAYALTWYDKDEDKMFFIRNKERPLCWTRRKDRDVIYWASLPWMLELALSYASIQHEEIHTFETDTLYSFDMSEPLKFRTIDWQIEKDVKGYNPPPQVAKKHNKANFQGGYHGWWGDDNYYDDVIPNDNKTSEVKKSNVSPFPASSAKSSHSTNAEDKETIQAMKGAVNKDIKFRFSGVRKGISGAEYLLCYPDNPLIGMEIRVFGAGHDKWSEWRTKLHTYVFEGTAKRFVRNNIRGKKEHYLLIDLRTIKELGKKIIETVPKNKAITIVPLVTAEEEKKARDVIEAVKKEAGVEDHDGRFYEGYNGSYLAYDEWKRATEGGCSGCGNESDPEDQELVFTGHDTWLCGECMSLDFYKQIVNNTVY